MWIRDVHGELEKRQARRDRFVTKVLGWARQDEILRILDDQIRDPTWARMLAEATSEILARGNDYLSEHKGIYITWSEAGPPVVWNGRVNYWNSIRIWRSSSARKPCLP